MFLPDRANTPFKSLFGERVCAGVDSLIKIPLIMIARCAFLYAATGAVAHPTSVPDPLIIDRADDRVTLLVVR